MLWFIKNKNLGVYNMKRLIALFCTLLLRGWVLYYGRVKEEKSLLTFVEVMTRPKEL